MTGFPIPVAARSSSSTQMYIFMILAGILYPETSITVLNLTDIGLQAQEVMAWQEIHAHAAIKWAFLLLNKSS